MHNRAMSTARRLDDIGFFTLSDLRARGISETSRMTRGELLLTTRCNFKCPYCRGLSAADLLFEDALKTLDLWAAHNLYAVRFSGGEPTTYPYLVLLVEYAKKIGIEKIAISTNGSAPWHFYGELLAAGANDFSVSLDACCQNTGDIMAGKKGAWLLVVKNLRKLAGATYTTAGIVVTEDNLSQVGGIIRLAAGLGVADIRVIPAAQYAGHLTHLPQISKMPILRYRASGFRPVRGLTKTDSRKCFLVLDDMAAFDGKHYPCIIYLREGGQPIGAIGQNMRHERAAWFLEHDSFSDRICSTNCLDVCAEFNNAARYYH